MKSSAHFHGHGFLHSCRCDASADSINIHAVGCLRAIGLLPPLHTLSCSDQQVGFKPLFLYAAI